MAFKDFSLFRVNIKRETGFAFGTLLIFWGANYLGGILRELEPANGFLNRLTDIGVLFFWIMLANIFLGVFFPAAYVTHEEKEKIETLGYTGKRLPLALLLSVVGAAILFFGLFQSRLLSADVDLVTWLLSAALTFWVPFFICGWLQTRFDRAFGAVLGIVLAAGSLALVHVGSASPDQLIEYLIIGAVMAVIFRISGSIFSVWPILSTVAVAATTLGSVEYTWGTVIGFAVIIAFQFMAFGWTVDKAHSLAQMGTD